MNDEGIVLLRMIVTQLKSLYGLVFVEEDADEEKTSRIIEAADLIRDLANDGLFDATDKTCFEQAWQLAEDIHNIVGGNRITYNGVKALKSLVVRTLNTCLSAMHRPLVISVSEEILQRDG